MDSGLSLFKKVWVVDFEYIAPPGERPKPVCVCAEEVHSGTKIRQWLHDEFPSVPPYEIGRDSLFVSFQAAAEISCHFVLGWPKPARILDLYAEFRWLTNGITTVAGKDLLGALIYFGLRAMSSAEKEEMRAEVLRGPPWSPAEQEAILRYCESDVRSTAELLHRMLPDIDFPRAVLRGRYMGAVASIEHVGVPINTGLLSTLVEQWGDIQWGLVNKIDADYQVGLIPEKWTVEKCSSAQVKGAEGNEEKSVQ
jgi:DNA polymerase I